MMERAIVALIAQTARHARRIAQPEFLANRADALAVLDPLDREFPERRRLTLGEALCASRKLQ